ncbi:MAG TPA: serine/threonine-protein kinase [Thermoanaerobaculia bacterium]|nr:serine/threonine-protein kinase [Thermoanaerobaculia bacterium]
MSAQPPTDEPIAHGRPEETPTVIAGERPAHPLQFTPGQILGGRYRIVSLIGRGGMGDVYRADDLRIGHSVALKFLSRREHAHRLYDEVRVGREISHPNLCRLYDAAEVDGQLFITMELIDGEDLASLLRRVGRLPPEKALAVSRDICAGVAAAHEKGIVHRDLKPANVMIDGRGRARVTDFGLAVAEERVSDRSGTPAYMAPEQLEGAPASVASDVYALGLVLYEIFTGRRAFESTSMHDLLMRQQAVDLPRPSSVTRDVPAAVESLILRCLEPDPQARPRSVGEILRELPGGDPLAAAIAAGETPTPGMVAAAAKTGDLPAHIAWVMFSIAVAGLIATAVISPRTLLNRVADMKAPDVLRERARDVLFRAGLTERPADSDLFVALEPFTGRLTAVYRQARWPMRPRNPDGRLLAFDPPLDQGMANVHLDGDGRLRRFIIAPPVIDKSGAAPAPAWEPFISAAGYDPRSLSPTNPEWAAAVVVPGRSASSFVDSDSKAAWLTKDGNRIEAASYRGRPVFFSVITPEVARVAAAPAGGPQVLPERLAFGMFVFFMIAIPIAGLLLARVNLRRGQGDRTGAFRTAMFFLFVALAGLVFRAHHPMRFVDEWMIISWHAAQAAFWALMTATMYIAIEPYVRKRWPSMLISWTRLLSGRSTDPMVGRDVLLGAAGAAISILLWQATHLVIGQTAFFTTPSTLGPPRFVVAAVAWTLAEAVLRGVGLVILLVVLRAVISSDSAASVLSALFIATMTIDDTYGPLWLRALYAVSASLLAVILARHCGLLAVISYAFFVLIQQRLPLTLDGDAWFFGRSAVVMLLLIAAIACAFRVSVGAKRWLPRFAFE